MNGALTFVSYTLAAMAGICFIERHITGGILLSVSLLFGGLAATVMTIQNKEDNEYDQDE